MFYQMKANILKLMPMCFICAISACNGSVMIVEDHLTSIFSTTNMTSTSLYFSASKSNGYIVYAINVKEGQSLSIKCNATIDLGALTFDVTKQDEEEAFFHKIVTDNLDFEIPLQEYGKYKIKVIHDEFKGSYCLNWANN